MSIHFACENCGQKLSVGLDKVGMRSKCPRCANPIVVPTPTAATPKPPVPSKPASKETKAPSSEEKKESTPSNETATTAVPPPPPLAAFAPASPPAVQESGSFDFRNFDGHSAEAHDDDRGYVYIDEDAETELKIDRARVSVARWAIYSQGIMLCLIAIVSFTLGFMSRGGNSAPSRPEQRLPVACTISGRVSYTVQSGGKFPDDGAVVVVVPQGMKPGVDEKARFEGLRPNDPIPDDSHDAIGVITSIGGAYGRTDGKGDFRLRLPDGGDFYVLVISNRGKRKAGGGFKKTDLAQMGHYFLDATELIGNQSYRWQATSINRDKVLNFVLD